MALRPQVPHPCTSHYLCGLLVVEIGNYARSGISEVVDLLAAVHYISRDAAIWDPPKSVKRLLNVLVFLNVNVDATHLWDSNPRL